MTKNKLHETIIHDRELGIKVAVQFYFSHNAPCQSRIIVVSRGEDPNFYHNVRARNILAARLGCVAIVEETK